MRPLDTFMKRRQGNSPHCMSQCLISETGRMGSFTGTGRREVEKVLPENTITANIHVRRMKNTELYMFLQSDPCELVGVVSLVFAVLSTLPFSFSLIRPIF